ncbi:hypothetical protein JCM8097_002408 [Rhodosporidiobolus ruineniae]
MSCPDAPSGLPTAPPPWTLAGRGWIFPTYTPFSPTPIPLPDGAYAPLEQGSKADQSGHFHGGVGMVFVVRYETSDVGPYDELIYTPGLFSSSDSPADKPHYHLSITRIYVSTDASVYNGRRNWGIPKHRGVFSFTTLSPSRTLLTVSHPSSPSSPFFRAILADSRLTPFAMPVNTTWLSWRLSRWLMDGYTAEIFQPALPFASEADEEKKASVQATGQALEALVGSEETYRLSPPSKGWSRLAYLEEAPPEEGEGGKDWSGFGDGVGFPRFKVAVEGPLKGRGVHLTSFTMGFPVGTVVGEE